MCYFAAKQQTDYCTTMKIEHVKLTQVKINAENPRTISRPKFQKLIDSILAFPAMLEIRPVVVDSTMVALGGNQRLSALKEIAKMSAEELAARLYRLPEYQEKGEIERTRLVEFWETWRERPTIQIVNARHLTERERKQFIIKDNVSYGAWDYEALANKWDAQRLEAWGMDVWTGIPIAAQAGESSGDTDSEPPSTDPLNGLDEALPPELQGLDLVPDPLDNIKGDDDTPSDHIIITYTPEERDALAAHIGVAPDQLFSKICWRIDELKGLTAKEEPTNEDN